MRKKATRAHQLSLLQTASTILVTMHVLSEHPLLVLKRRLDWPAIREVILNRLRLAGRNVDHGPGQPLDVELYVPLLVLQLITNKSSREMEAYLAENAPARVFVDWEHNARMQVRDHSNIARIMESLGEEGIKELNALIVRHAVALGFGDTRTLSADTTAQELPIGYPHEAGILKGLAERCSRALEKLKGSGKRGLKKAQELCQTIVYKAKEYHLFAKTEERKDAILRSMVRQTRQLLWEAEVVSARFSKDTTRVVSSASGQLDKMASVGRQLLPQILYWLKTGTVAKGKILHAGLTNARAIVRNKVGKKVEFGLQYLVCAIGGGYLLAELIDKPTGETKMPMKALAAYQSVFTEEVIPELFVYDRGGSSEDNRKKLKRAGVKKVGIQPKGKAPWLVHGKDRKTVTKERAMMEGRIGSLKSDKYKFNKPKDRKTSTVRASGQRAVVSFNLNKLMRDLTSQPAMAAARA
jgi:hypothetical protein